MATKQKGLFDKRTSGRKLGAQKALKQSVDSAPRQGRPPLFNRTKALGEAMKLFWDRGYEGTSFDQLLEAMEISPSSFYNSFESKERLYEQAVEHYLAGPGNFFDEALSAETDTRTAFERLAVTTAEMFTRKELPTGCMVLLGSLHLAPTLGSVRKMMKQYRSNSERMLADRLRIGVASGELSPETDVQELAAYFIAVFDGMAVQARDGAPRKRLISIARRAMSGWPKPGTRR